MSLVDHIIPSKSCSICHQVFPTTTTYFHKDSAANHGLSSRCKRCTQQKSKAYYALHAAQNRTKSRNYHRAHREECCEKMRERYRAHRPAELERMRKYKRLHHRQILEYARKYHATNREKCLQRIRTYKATHKEAIKAWEEAYRLKYRERIQAAARRYYLANHAKILQSASRYRIIHREQVREKSRRYKKTHPEWNRAAQKRRRSQKVNAAINDFTAGQWQAMQIQYDHRCVYCGKRCKGKLTQDHLTPLSKGGNHTASNIVPACKRCNSKKHTGPPLVPVQPVLLLG